MMAEGTTVGVQGDTITRPDLSMHCLPDPLSVSCGLQALSQLTGHAHAVPADRTQCPECLQSCSPSSQGVFPNAAL